MRGKRIKTKQDAIDLVNEQHRNHKGKWLTAEVAEASKASTYIRRNIVWDDRSEI